MINQKLSKLQRNKIITEAIDAEEIEAIGHILDNFDDLLTKTL